MRKVITAAAPALLVPTLIIGAVATGSSQVPTTRKVYVSVTEKNGTPVTDLTAADFELKAGGKPQQVASAQLTKTPIRIALIVADGGTGAFLYPAATFVQRLQEVAEFAIVAVPEQPDRIVDFTTDIDKVVAGLKRMGTRSGKPTTGQVMEAITETVKDVGRSDKRSVIVVMTLGGSTASPLRADVVREDLRKSGTTLYVISPAGSSGGRGASAGGGGGGNMGAARTDYAASESADRGRELEVVLNDGSRESGGRNDQVSGPNITKAAEQICQELLNQYEVSYAPEGVKAGDKLELLSKRKGLKVNAPSRVSN